MKNDKTDLIIKIIFAIILIISLYLIISGLYSDDYLFDPAYGRQSPWADYKDIITNIIIENGVPAIGPVLLHTTPWPTTSK